MARRESLVKDELVRRRSSFASDLRVDPTEVAAKLAARPTPRKVQYSKPVTSPDSTTSPDSARPPARRETVVALEWPRRVKRAEDEMNRMRAELDAAEERAAAAEARRDKSRRDAAATRRIADEATATAADREAEVARAGKRVSAITFFTRMWLRNANDLHRAIARAWHNWLRHVRWRALAENFFRRALCARPAAAAFAQWRAATVERAAALRAKAVSMLVARANRRYADPFARWRAATVERAAALRAKALSQFIGRVTLLARRTTAAAWRTWNADPPRLILFGEMSQPRRRVPQHFPAAYALCSSEYADVDPWDSMAVVDL